VRTWALLIGWGDEEQITHVQQDKHARDPGHGRLDRDENDTVAVVTDISSEGARMQARGSSQHVRNRRSTPHSCVRTASPAVTWLPG